MAGNGSCRAIKSQKTCHSSLVPGSATVNGHW